MKNKKIIIAANPLRFFYSWMASLSDSLSQTNYPSTYSGVSDDGSTAVFMSSGSLAPQDTNSGLSNIYVRNASGTFVISVSPAGVIGDGNSYSPSISGNGRYVGYHSSSTNLVVGDTNNQIGSNLPRSIRSRLSMIRNNPNPTKKKKKKKDCFVYDIYTGNTIRTSLIDQTNQQSFTGGCSNVHLNWDGSIAAFESTMTDLVPGYSNGYNNVFVRNITSSRTLLVSISNLGLQADYPSFNPSVSGYFFYFTNPLRLPFQEFVKLIFFLHPSYTLASRGKIYRLPESSRQSSGPGIRPHGHELGQR